MFGSFGWGLAVIALLGIVALSKTSWMRNTLKDSAAVVPEIVIHQKSVDPLIPLGSWLDYDRENAEFEPDLTSIALAWPHGTLTLGEVIHRGHESVVYLVRETPNLLVKYQANCDSLKKNDYHPLVKEFHYGKHAHSLGISPNPLFVSPATAIIDSHITDLFKMNRDELVFCSRRGGSMRFLVLERNPVHRDLYSFQGLFPERIVPIHIAMQIGINIVDSLQRLHRDAKIVHGDIHLGNVLIDSETLDVQIIDFGLSRYNSRKFLESPVNRFGYWYHSALTHWQIAGFEWSMRDDIFNAMRTIALLMNSEQYSTYEKQLTRDYGLSEWRAKNFIFSIPEKIGKEICRTLIPSTHLSCQKMLKKPFEHRYNGCLFPFDH